MGPQSRDLRGIGRVSDYEHILHSLCCLFPCIFFVRTCKSFNKNYGIITFIFHGRELGYRSDIGHRNVVQLIKHLQFSYNSLQICAIANAMFFSLHSLSRKGSWKRKILKRWSLGMSGQRSFNSRSCQGNREILSRRKVADQDLAVPSPSPAVLMS